jgi:hypothetical protein
MLYRFFIFLILTSMFIAPTSAEDLLAGKDQEVPDCTWKPFKIFTNGYVRSPKQVKDEPLYLRKEPSDATILAGTQPFDWQNALCNLWPGMPLRIADEGKPEDRFAKIYYDDFILWVSKTWSDGSPTLLPITPITSEKRQDTQKQ